MADNEPTTPKDESEPKPETETTVEESAPDTADKENESAAHEVPAETEASIPTEGEGDAVDTGDKPIEGEDNGDAVPTTEGDDKPEAEGGAEVAAEGAAEEAAEGAAPADENAAAPDTDAPAAEGEADQPAADATAVEGEGGTEDAGTAAEGEAGTEGEVTEGQDADSGDAPDGATDEAKEGDTEGAVADGDAVAGEEIGEPNAEGGEPPADGEQAEPLPEGAADEGQLEQSEEKPEGDAMPQSDTFADGEKPESPAPRIGENLSREGSPTAGETKTEDVRTFSPPVADSPREDEHIEEPFNVEDLEDDMLSPEQDREALVEMFHAAIAEREQLQQQNHQLQHKLAEYFKRRRSDEQKPEAVDKNEADQEQRYVKYMSQLEELRAEDELIRRKYESEIADLQRKCEEKQQEVDAHRVKFVEFKHQVALNSLNSRSGKPIPPRDIEQYLGAENRKDQEVIAVRLENIKLKNKLKKKEQQLKSKEELADGLHLIDFEQLKIENQTYNEKIEERNEELLKLRKKITNTVQVLTHLKEKLQFVQGENSLLKNKLKDVEGAVAVKRDVLTRTKQARDALRIDNHRLRQNCGLLGNEPLLRDFEERKDEADGLKDRLERLKMQHAELTLNTASVRRKIEQIKANEHN